MSYTINFKNNSAYLKISNFDLDQTLDCGQAFRWRENNGIYLGVAFSRVLNLKKNQDDIIEIWPCNEYEFNNYWKNYFDLDRDYSAVIEMFACDSNLYKAACFGSGIRILKQELWETLISFIISANNSIHRIKKIIDKICTRWGTQIDELNYAFPTPQELSQATIEQLTECGAGYRAKYILDTAVRVNEGYPLDKLYSMPLSEARSELKTFAGVGPKVAECIALYALGRMEAFPVDTWIKKAMESMYLNSSCNQQTIMQEADRLFAGYAGLAQQYLFYYARSKKIKGLNKPVDIDNHE